LEYNKWSGILTEIQSKLHWYVTQKML
jgi:hypothetical protein